MKAKSPVKPSLSPLTYLEGSYLIKSVFRCRNISDYSGFGLFLAKNAMAAVEVMITAIIASPEISGT